MRERQIRVFDRRVWALLLVSRARFGTVGKWKASALWLVAERIWGASVLSPLDHRCNIPSGTHVED